MVITYVTYFLESHIYSSMIGIYSFCMICMELKQFITDRTYFSNAINLCDCCGNIGLVIYSIQYKAFDMSYRNESTHAFLILGLCMCSLRTVS